MKRAATERVFGFEILPAPFVVAHLQIGLLLAELGAPLARTTATARARRRLPDQRADRLDRRRALPADRSTLPELEEERDAAEQVKQDEPILVMLGNPPYNGYAGMAMDDERDLAEAYRHSSHSAPRRRARA